jgi:hypothetical protein
VLARQRGVPALDSLWAEDGAIFLQAALERPFAANLVTPYAGYLNLVPRLLAEIAALVPLRLAAPLLSGSAALALAALAALVFRASRAHVRSAGIRAFLAAAMLLLPAAGLESLSCLANLHWQLVFASVWMLLWVPERAGQRAVACGVLLAATLSDPFGALLLPLALARLLTLGPGREQAVSAACAVGVALQLAAILANPEPRELALPAAPLDLAGAWARDVLEPAAFGLAPGEWLRAAAGPFVPALLALALAAALTTPVLRRRASPKGALRAAGERSSEPGERSVVLVLLVLHLVLFAAPVALKGKSSPRYAVAPTLLLLCALGFATDRGGSPAARRGARLAAALAASAWLVDFAPPNRRVAGPSWRAELARAAASCADTRAGEARLRVSPLPAPSSPRAWEVRVPCARLLNEGTPRSQ